MAPSITFSGRFNYKPGTGCALHAHDKDFQVQLIYKGNATMQINDSTFHVKEGDVVFLKKGSIHSFIAGNKLKTVELKFDAEPLALLDEIKTIFQDQNEQLFNIMSMIVIEGQKRGLMYKEICNCLLMQALIYMVRLCNGYTAPMLTKENNSYGLITNGKNAIEAVETYIYKNIDKNFTLKELSDAVGYNQDYLYRVIKRNKGMTLIQYVNKIKYKEAKRLISHSDLSISEISYSLGFESIAYFSRFFKKYAGITPSEYSIKVRNSIRTVY